MHDVVVVGGGPAGCYTAYQLAREGFDVLILEKNGTSKQPPVCTGVVGVEAFEKFDLPRHSILTDVKDIHFVSPSGKLVSYCPGDIQAHVVDRLTFNDGLRGLALSGGATIREGTACVGIDITEAHVELKTSPNGTRVRARAAVLACGHNPYLTKKLGLGVIADHYEGAQTELQMEDLSATEIYVGRNVAPSSFAWAVKLKDGRARVGLVTRERAAQFLKAFLGSRFLNGRIRGTGRILRKAIPFGGLERTFGNRLLAVGEVAGQVKTTTHGGIYYGLIGARAAAETLKEALQHNELSAERLEAYEKRWRSLLESELEKGQILRGLFECLSDKQIDRLFSIARKNNLMKLVHKKARFDWPGESIVSLMEHGFIEHFRNWL
jgi:digeranylgeranylglycerophospholipid reductase